MDGTYDWLVYWCGEMVGTGWWDFGTERWMVGVVGILVRKDGVVQVDGIIVRSETDRLGGGGVGNGTGCWDNGTRETGGTSGCSIVVQRETDGTGGWWLGLMEQMEMVLLVQSGERVAASPISLLSMGGVCGRSLTPGKFSSLEGKHAPSI